MSQQPLAALTAAQEQGQELQFWGNDQPKCPHCGKEMDIDDRYRLYEEGSHDITCDHCDLDFRVSTRVSYTFNTDEQEPRK